MDELLHFPDDFPNRALAVLAPVIRSGGTVTDKVLAGEALLTLQGWAMGQYLGHDHGPNVVGSSGPAPSLSGQVSEKGAMEALDELEAGVPTATATATDGDGAHAVGAFDPKKFAERAFKLIKFLLPLILAA